ncbi:nephrin [Alligator mississippiensis]|uniref:Nephrin n=1 Tax=Alligator mississippiensis TaxID=8496 RepID=A0A151NCW8_ALLMI|nr:nephrin [Alligator mississippiensis]
MARVFVEEPDNTTVRAGGEAALRCRVQTLTGLAQWAKDGLLLGPSRGLPGFPRYSLTGDASKGELHLRIVGARLEDDGRYECQATPGPDGHAWVSRPALLTVLVPPQPPEFAEQKPDSIVTWVAGEEQTVTCSAPDAQPPAQVTLARGDQPLPEASSHVEPGSHEKLSTTKATVRFTPEILDNGRRLLCEALNEAISTPLLSSFIMNILYPPQPPTIEGLQRSEVKAGEILKLTCVSVGGNPLATLQWIKAGAVVSTTWATAGGAGASRSTLILTVQPEDHGAVLSCEALSPLLPAPLRASLNLNVLYPPAEVMLSGVGSVPENGTLDLSCSAGPSRPPAALRWWLGGRELPPSDGSIIPDAHGGAVTVSNVSVLAQRSADGLALTCEAFNSALRLSRAASLVLAITYPPERLWLEAPPPEPPLRAGTTLRLRCYVTGGSPTPRLIWIKDSRVLREGTQVSSGRTVSKELLLTAAPSDNMAAYRCNASSDAKGTPLSALTRLRVQCEDHTLAP